MAQDYYTLEEAADIVRMSPDDLKQMARKGELRSFQDRGTWRFRVQDIQELARRRGMGSDPELVLGDLPPPKPTDSPAPRSPKPPKSREAEVFDFPMEDDNVGLGNEFLLEVPGSSKKLGTGSSKKIPKEAPKSPPPPPGSDSDVRLVADGSDLDFQIPLDSDVKMVHEPPSTPPKPRGKSAVGGPASPSPKPRGKSGMSGPASPPPARGGAGRSGRTGMTSGAPPVDSGVRLVPMDSDSDVRIVGAGSDEVDLPIGLQPPKSSADSDIRLEKARRQPPPSDEGMMTEEINLDEELRKEAAGERPPQAKVRPKSGILQDLSPTSPFELSEADLNLPPEETEPAPQVKKAEESSSDFELTPAADESSPLDGSSDFELTPAGASTSPLEPSSDEEFRLELPEDEVGLGEIGPVKGPRSGISLDNPADSGISLEQVGEGSDEIEFELTLDAGNTPKPQAAAAEDDSDSEFELTLDADEPKGKTQLGGAAAVAAGDDSDSEFELTLDSAEGPAGVEDSDSEFELTLDESGGFSQAPDAGAQVKGDSDEKDIFETDFEVPALDDESGSQAVALDDADTDLDSSDFDIALDSDDAGALDESGSAVVALDEDTPAPPRKKKKPASQVAFVDDQESFDELVGAGDDDSVAVAVADDQEDFAPARTVVKEKLIPAAPWGPMPLIFMLPCVLVMCLLALLGFELVQSMNGYKSPGVLTKALGDLLGQKVK